MTVKVSHVNLYRKIFRKPEPTVVVALPQDLRSALDDLAQTFTSYGTAEAGESFTCKEADAIARVLAVAGHKDEAVTWLEGHAGGDEVDDLHYTYDETDPEDEGRVLTERELVEYVEELAL
ncbi:hypothetical protein ABZ960_20545 [Streptomyces pseudovenezuelae]|uniref:hypothetical protein n=1 Tax=Streptomyces pseudovenezuelae TaxID=67350 RepID=UPI0034A5782A